MKSKITEFQNGDDSNGITDLTGKKEEWQKFLDEGFNGPGRAETVRVRDEVGVHERSFLQETPGGDFVIITLEGRDPLASWAKMMESMPEEMKQKAAEFHGMDLKAPPPPMPKLVFDSWE